MEGPEDPLLGAMSEEEAAVDRRGMISRAVEQVFSSAIELRETGWEVGMRVCANQMFYNCYPHPQALLGFQCHLKSWEGLGTRLYNCCDSEEPQINVFPAPQSSKS